MTWDENLYYQYGEAVGYAYSIPAHLSSDFDINRAYGPSAGDHKVYGPIYLLITRIPVLALRSSLTGLDIFSLWHLFKPIRICFPELPANTSAASRDLSSVASAKEG